VPGGGVALIRALKALKDLEGANEDQTVGIRLLARAMEEPLRHEEGRQKCRPFFVGAPGSAQVFPSNIPSGTAYMLWPSCENGSSSRPE
jgi:hypothetical protein